MTKKTNDLCPECEDERTDGMMNCDGPRCKKWIHFECDKEVVTEENARKIKTYYCPACKKKGMVDIPK